MDMASDGVEIGGIRYVRAPQPIHFPDSADVPESRLHEDLCALLRALLRYAFEKEHSVGGDQFIYWDAAQPRQCIAADAFVRLGQPDSRFKTWKVWERGAPELAIEILSESDADSVEQKVVKYASIGVSELVAFDPECEPSRLRVWDRLQGDLIERELTGTAAISKVLPGYWVVSVDERHGATLRLAHDAEGKRLFPTPAEAEAEARKTEASALERRIRELEAELARRGG
jgi:Uma2 family endonuclease